MVEVGLTALAVPKIEPSTINRFFTSDVGEFMRDVSCLINDQQLLVHFSDLTAPGEGLARSIPILIIG